MLNFQCSIFSNDRIDIAFLRVAFEKNKAINFIYQKFAPHLIGSEGFSNEH